MEIVNKKAYFNYFIDSELEAGIVLKGTEIKSVRKGSVNLTDSYVRIKNNEAYIINMFIDKYDEGNIFNHDPTRERKLLLHKKEIKRLLELTSRDGYTLVPVKLYIKNDKAKISIGIAKGKKLYDKRDDIAKKDQKREAEREFKIRNFG